MNRRLVILLTLLITLMLLGCQSYTSRDGLASIQPLPPQKEEPIITKYSILQEQKAEKENAILRAQQEQEAALALAQEKKAKTELQTKLTSLTEEKKSLLVQIDQLKTTLEKQKTTLIELQNLNEAQAQELSQTQAERVLSALKTEEKYQASLQNAATLTEANAKLNQQILELQALLEEKESTIRQTEQLAAEKTAQMTAQLQTVEDTLEELRSDNTVLQAQLAEKNLTIEEKIRLDQQRQEEAKRLADARLEAKKAQETEARLQAEALEAERLALEKERMQIPPLSSITYPRIYSTEKNSTLAKDGDKLRTIMLPLDDVAWKNPKMANEVYTSIKDLSVPVVFVTGHMENVIALVKEMRTDAVLFSTGAIITTFPIVKTSDFGVTVQYSDKVQIRLSLINLPQYEVLQAFLENNDWQTLQKVASEERLKKLETIVEEGSSTDPTLIGASLYEPSYQDWNTFSPVSYRQMDYLWPLSEFLEQAGFYDSYRITHFNEATDAGNTLIAKNWKERVDYLFSRKMLPLESSMLTIGGESVPDENTISRFGIFSAYLIP